MNEKPWYKRWYIWVIALIIIELVYSNIYMGKPLPDLTKIFETSSDTQQEAETRESSPPPAGVSTSLKARLDRCETSIDEYCEYMEEYNSHKANTNTISKYSDYVIKLKRVEMELDSIDDEDLSTAERKYYTEVKNRIEKRVDEAEKS